MEAWTKEDVREKICVCPEKSTSLEIIVRECALQFAQMTKYSVREPILPSGHKALDALLLTFV